MVTVRREFTKINNDKLQRFQSNNKSKEYILRSSEEIRDIQ